GGTCHAAALLGAGPARLGATPAVILLVLGALRAAGVTDLRADAADVVHEVRPPAHVSRRRPADLGAITGQPNALGHLLHVGLVQAGVGTVLALLSAPDASVDAGLCSW